MKSTDFVTFCLIAALVLSACTPAPTPTPTPTDPHHLEVKEDDMFCYEGFTGNYQFTVRGVNPPKLETWTEITIFPDPSLDLSEPGHHWIVAKAATRYEPGWSLFWLDLTDGRLVVDALDQTVLRGPCPIPLGPPAPPNGV